MGLVLIQNDWKKTIMMTEKEMLLQTWEREFPVTIKVLKALPEGQGDFKPHEMSRTAKEMVWTFVTEEKVILDAFTGTIDFRGMPPAPATFAEALATYEKSHRDLIEQYKKVSEDDFNTKMVPFLVGPKHMGELHAKDVAWMMVMDSVHHRGQFSIYLRMAGGKVPSIYGPSGDEPWD